MPVLRNQAQRIAPGWISKSALLAGSSYLLANFTINSDQKTDNQVLVPWIGPVNTSQLPKRTVYDKMLSGIQRGQGFVEFDWKLSLFTFGMVGTFAALYTDTEISQAVTVLNYDEQNVDRYFQCYITPLSVWISSGTPVLGGFQNITIPFEGGTEIFA